MWNRRLERGQIIKTTTPITMWNTHSPLRADTPFVRVLESDEVDRLVPLPARNASRTLDCMLCKNYHHRCMTRSFEDMEKHVLDT
jgi:hypothetical protein